MEKQKENAPLAKEEKFIITLSYIVSAILILCIGYLIATIFIEFPWEKNAPTVSPEEFEVQWLNIANKTFFICGIAGGVFIAFNLIRFILNKFVKQTPQSENAKTGIIVGSIMLTVSYLAYFLTNYEPGYSSGESDGNIAAILILSIFVMNLFIWKKK